MLGACVLDLWICEYGSVAADCCQYGYEPLKTNKMRRTLWLAEKLVAFHGLSSLELRNVRFAWHFVCS